MVVEGDGWKREKLSVPTVACARWYSLKRPIWCMEALNLVH